MTPNLASWQRSVFRISLGMRPANERRRYNVTTSFIGWAYLDWSPPVLIPVNVFFSHSQNKVMWCGGMMWCEVIRYGHNIWIWDSIRYNMIWKYIVSYHIISYHIISYHIIYHNNIERHTAHTIVSWPNLKQWQVGHTSDLIIMSYQISNHIIMGNESFTIKAVELKRNIYM